MEKALCVVKTIFYTVMTLAVIGYSILTCTVLKDMKTTFED